MLGWITYFMGYFGAGFSLKAGDDLLDEADRETLAWFPLGISGLLFGLIMSVSQWDLVLMASIIIAVVASGKVNRVQFSIGFVLIFAILLVMGLPPITLPLDLSAIMMLLFMAGVLDEKGENWADRTRSPRAVSFFEHRFSLKIVVLFLCIPWPEFLPSAIGLWIFDIGYELAAYFTRRAISQG
jgi:hypothetical protein